MKPESKIFLKKAADFLEDARFLAANERLLGAMNRAYYAAFEAILALLFEKEAFTKTHAGAQIRFYELFVATEIFSKNSSSQLKWLFSKRQKADYEAAADFEKEEIDEALEIAADFVEKAKIWPESQP